MHHRAHDLNPFQEDAGCVPGAAGTYYWRVRATTDEGVVTDSSPPRSARSPTPRRWSPLEPGGRRIGRHPQADLAAVRRRLEVPRDDHERRRRHPARPPPPRPRSPRGPGARSVDLSLDGAARSTRRASSAPACCPVASRPSPLVAPPGGHATDAGAAPAPDVVVRFPTLTWTPVVDADKYSVWIRPAGAPSATRVGADFGYPEGQDYSALRLVRRRLRVAGRRLRHGDVLIERQHDRHLHHRLGPAVIGLRGRARGQPAHRQCIGRRRRVRGEPAQRCQNLRQTPRCRGTPSPNTGYYGVWIARDAR